MIRLPVFAATLLLTAFAGDRRAWSDPCGMVPPAWTDADDTPIRRVGPQKTYVFHHEDIETMVLHPGFSGKIDQFGMLIPFPSPPAIRKVPDDTFKHIQNAIDPPEVPLWLNPLGIFSSFEGAGGLGARGLGAGGGGLSIGSMAKDEVRVIRREAVGMYEVAVLAAGSAKALKKWMDEQEFRYPEGMDKVTNDYVEAAWCFVAVKAKVGKMAGVKPKPGMRKINSKLPEGEGFNGSVQAMAFRFKSKKLVVPMRLSAFNPGERRNVVYLLTEKPKRLRGLPRSSVVRQVSGKDLVRNLSGRLPVRVMDGKVRDVKLMHLENLKAKRDPEPHLKIARELFASDLRAVHDGKLIHEHEKLEKKLLNISEELGMRGKDIDILHKNTVEKESELIYEKTLKLLRKMTLTVIDAEFPVAFVAKDNLYFVNYRMKAKKNTPEFYDAKTMAGIGKKSGPVFWGVPKHIEKKKKTGWGR